MARRIREEAEGGVGVRRERRSLSKVQEEGRETEVT